MKEYTTEFIRNVALVSHSSAGKTMLTDAFLHVTGATTRLGKVEDGTTTSDYDEEEVRRGISLYTTVVPVEYKDVKINVLDTPGYNDFIGEVISALRVADSAIVLVDAVAGREVGTELAWEYCNRFDLPRFVVVNKMNRDNANFQKAIASVEELSDTRLIPVQIPLGEKADFNGVIDLISMKAFKGDGKTPSDIPAEYQSQAEEARMGLVEAAAEGDDSLMEKYFEQGELTEEEIVRGLRNIVRSNSFIPVFVAAGGHEIGVTPLLNAIVNLMPSPPTGLPSKRRARLARKSSPPLIPVRSHCMSGKRQLTRLSANRHTSGFSRGWSVLTPGFGTVIAISKSALAPCISRAVKK
jgi:elongation factor G